METKEIRQNLGKGFQKKTKTPGKNPVLELMLRELNVFDPAYMIVIYTDTLPNNWYFQHFLFVCVCLKNICVCLR